MYIGFIRNVASLALIRHSAVRRFKNSRAKLTGQHICDRIWQCREFPNSRVFREKITALQITVIQVTTLNKALCRWH